MHPEYAAVELPEFCDSSYLIGQPLYLWLLTIGISIYGAI